jgi:hypothetical protein
MIANMNKAAAHIAYKAGQKGIIFSKITTYGLLIDYKVETITKVYRLVLDFNTNEGRLLRCEKPLLNISVGLSRVISCLQGELMHSLS